MGTPLSELYNRFQTKVDEDLTGKESLIFALVNVAISRAYKTCKHTLSYSLDEDEELENNNYEGYFDYELDNDEIELLALWMLYEWNKREQQRLVKQREFIGTTDFNRLPSKKDQIIAINLVIETIKDEINKLTNDFNTYQYS